MGKEILNEQVLYEQGCFRKVRRWIKGWHPEGKLTMGYQGKETIQTIDQIEPQGTFEVRQENKELAAEKK